MKDKLYQTLKNYSNKTPLRFHMPSHNGEDIGISTSMDITELSFSDNLIASDSVIARTEQNIAKAYNVPYALMLTNGATLGVAIALFAAKQKGDNLLVVGDCHKSIYNYAHIFGLNLHFAKALNGSLCYDKYAAVIVTTPNYFGKTFDLTPLKNTTALVIADSSHGSHFAFSDLLPDLNTAIADIIVLSFHKTLPVLTGGAGVLCKDKTIYDMLVYARSLLHSSSPNYLVMASIDKAICDFFENGKDYYKQVIASINEFKKTLNTRYNVVQTDDITRLCICLNGLNAEKFSKLLEAQNVYIEMTYGDLLVLIITPFNHKHLKLLASIVNNIKCEDTYIPIAQLSELNLSENQTKINTNFKKVSFCTLNEAIGKVCASNIGIYPPGVPVIHMGDKITEGQLSFLQNENVEIFGLTNNKIAVFIEDKKEEKL